MTFHPLFLYKKTLNFDLFLESLSSHLQGIHLPNELPLPSSPKSLASPALGLSSLQGSSPGPFRDALLLELSFPGLSSPEDPSFPLLGLSQPFLPSLSLLGGPSSPGPFRDSPPNPSCSFLLSPAETFPGSSRPSRALTSSLSAPLRCSPLALPLWEPGSLRLLPWQLHLSD